jgi:hypothetical protein
MAERKKAVGTLYVSNMRLVMGEIRRWLIESLLPDYKLMLREQPNYNKTDNVRIT